MRSKPFTASDTATSTKTDDAWIEGANEESASRADGAWPSRPWRVFGLPRVARFIVFLNAFGLVILFLGALFLSGMQRELIGARQELLRAEGEVISLVLAESAPPDALQLDPTLARAVVRRFSERVPARILLFDPSGQLVADTQLLRDEIVDEPLPPPENSALDRFWRKARSTIRSLAPETWIPGNPRRGARDRTLKNEVAAALEGDVRQTVRLNGEGGLIVSVSLPIKRIQAILGALTLESGGVDEIVRAERRAILPFFMMGLLVSVVSAALLSFRIAAPLRRLAQAAEQVRPGRIRVEIPDYTPRRDEIGELSGALRSMTATLYDRIDAIEAFAADVAHELKNPLTSLKSAVDTLERAAKPEQRARLIEIARHDVRRIDRLITDISNASRLDAELGREEMQVVSCGRLLHDVVQHEQASRNLALGYVGPRKNLWVRARAEPLARVFRNLIDNAVSFTPKGGVVTVLAGEAASRRRPEIEIAVEDEGPGVPERNLETIFERFYTDRPEHDGFGANSGLGLSICRQIVEAHGGRIWAENRPRGGARFVVRLPAA